MGSIYTVTGGACAIAEPLSTPEDCASHQPVLMAGWVQLSWVNTSTDLTTASLLHRCQTGITGLKIYNTVTGWMQER